MAGPTGITIIKLLGWIKPDPATIGVAVENVVTGDDLEDWEVKEFIDFDEDQSSEDIFDVKKSKTSDWLGIPGKDEHRPDKHYLSTGSIIFKKMNTDGTEYKCVYTQNFRKRKKSETKTEIVPNSGFIITHTVKCKDDHWEYFSEKTGSGVGAAEAGKGTIRYPESGWARVPI